MLETLRKVVEGGMGVLSSKRAQELAKSMVKEGQARAEQAVHIAGDLMEWSRENRHRLLEMVQREVKKQVGALGLVTRDQLDGVRRRVRNLEGAKASPSSPSKRASTAKAAGPKKTATARKSTAKKPTAKKRTAKRSATGAPKSSSTRSSTS